MGENAQIITICLSNCPKYHMSLEVPILTTSIRIHNMRIPKSPDPDPFYFDKTQISSHLINSYSSLQTLFWRLSHLFKFVKNLA